MKSKGNAINARWRRVIPFPRHFCHMANGHCTWMHLHCTSSVRKGAAFSLCRHVPASCFYLGSMYLRIYQLQVTSFVSVQHFVFYQTERFSTKHIIRFHRFVRFIAIGQSATWDRIVYMNESTWSKLFCSLCIRCFYLYFRLCADSSCQVKTTSHVWQRIFQRSMGQRSLIQQW